jgi:hypothetical protein
MARNKKVQFTDNSAIEKIEDLYKELDDHQRRIHQDYVRTKNEYITDMSGMVALGKLQNEKLTAISNILKTKLDMIKVITTRVVTKEMKTGSVEKTEAFDAMAMLDAIEEKSNKLKDMGRDAEV